MQLHTAAGALLATVALAAPAAALAQDGTGVTQKVKLRAVIRANDDGTFGGPVRGTPFGRGTAVYRVKVRGDQQRARYTATFAQGRITGVAVVTATPVGDGGDLTYAGTLDVRRGTRAFKGVQAKGLKVTGRASDGVIRLTIRGQARFPVTTR